MTETNSQIVVNGMVYPVPRSVVITITKELKPWAPGAYPERTPIERIVELYGPTLKEIGWREPGKVKQESTGKTGPMGKTEWPSKKSGKK